MELLSILITNNIIGESSRIGYGSAIAVVLLVISLAAIMPYLVQTFRKEAGDHDRHAAARHPRPPPRGTAARGAASGPPRQTGGTCSSP